jgi:hypothetical protein
MYIGLVLFWNIVQKNICNLQYELQIYVCMVEKNMRKDACMLAAGAKYEREYEAR